MGSGRELVESYLRRVLLGAASLPVETRLPLSRSIVEVMGVGAFFTRRGDGFVEAVDIR